jgi:Zn-dependent peptidase ImmA (M78 family)/DNA-binding XRE family transcriptional regulator
MSSFNPSRLRVARKRRLLNKTRFAEAIGVDLRTVTGYERGEYEPSPGTLALIARTLRFPVGFFAGGDLHEPSPMTASFRSLARMSAANREAALASGALAFLLTDWIEQRFTLPAPDLPDLREENPEAAAMTLRQQWGLGERPIRNMVHLLEAKGVRVFSMFEETAEVDAFSLWRATTPFVFLNTMKSAERSRFDAAHELGHLVLHRHAGAPTGREAEHEANRFASAFLMPRGSVFAAAPVLPSLDRLIELKRQWIVSVAAVAYRLHALGLLTDWHYTRLCIELAERGYRTNEPQPAQREMSQLLPKIFAAFRDDGITLSDIAAELQIEAEEIDKLVFRLMLLSLQGGATGGARSPRRTSLQVIK